MAQPLADRATSLSVLIMDGRSANRTGLRMVLETEPGVHVIGEASTLAEGLRFAKHHGPQVIILDLQVAGVDAVSSIRQLLAHCPACIIILLALFVDSETCACLVSAGAAACVEKDLPENLLRAFRDVRRHSSFPS